MKTRTQNVDRRQLLTLGTLLAAGVGLSLVPGLAHATGEVCTVYVAKGYLALRYAPGYDEANEIGELYTGDTVQVLSEGGTYWYVYSNRLGLAGYVNKNYLVSASEIIAGSTYTVYVQKGYLALRTEAATTTGT